MINLIYFLLSIEGFLRYLLFAGIIDVILIAFVLLNINRLRFNNELLIGLLISFLILIKFLLINKSLVEALVFLRPIVYFLILVNIFSKIEIIIPNYKYLLFCILTSFLTAIFTFEKTPPSLSYLNLNAIVSVFFATSLVYRGYKTDFLNLFIGVLLFSKILLLWEILKKIIIINKRFLIVTINFLSIFMVTYGLVFSTKFYIYIKNYPLLDAFFGSLLKRIEDVIPRTLNHLSNDFVIGSDQLIGSKIPSVDLFPLFPGDNILIYVLGNTGIVGIIFYYLVMIKMVGKYNLSIIFLISLGLVHNIFDSIASMIVLAFIVNFERLIKNVNSRN
ncbi:hypothetical protein N8835_03165 [Alphaproteobacteria bacterium]|nr:hypothetical protein [Alphaproteobacteria bacterium]